MGANNKKHEIYLELLETLYGLLAYALGFLLGGALCGCGVLAALDDCAHFIAHLPLDASIGSQCVFPGGGYACRMTRVDKSSRHIAKAWSGLVRSFE